MERTDKLNQLRQFNRPWEYDCCDIAEKLVELSNLPDDGQLKNELTDALYYLKAVAENPFFKTVCKYSGGAEYENLQNLRMFFR